MKYAFDSNMVIHLMRSTPSVMEHRDNARRGGCRFVIPPVVNYEILRGLKIKSAESQKTAYSVLCNNCLLGEMTQAAWERAADIYTELYKKHFTVADADIIIAAYCMENDCTLVTANVSDFENIDGLQYVNWVE